MNRNKERLKQLEQLLCEMLEKIDQYKEKAQGGQLLMLNEMEEIDAAIDVGNTLINSRELSMSWIIKEFENIFDVLLQLITTYPDTEEKRKLMPVYVKTIASIGTPLFQELLIN